MCGLLKNEGALPCQKDDSIAFIGEFAKAPRYQGGGSSHINSFRVDSAWEIASKDEELREKIRYAEGYSTKEDVVDLEKIKEAVELAKKSDKAVIFAGLPDNYESEGFDRKHMRIPAGQNALIEAVAEVNPNTIVVLHNGSPVEMPWVDKVNGILEVYLGGQAVGGAVIDILYGEVNPSGHLAESFPKKLSDNPSYLYYRGEGDKTEYREGVFVGYRYYDTKEMDVLFPFGHGLSYTTFAYSNIKVSKQRMSDEETVEVSVDVTNTGERKGKEVVQLYVAAPESEMVIRPVHELKGFEKVELDAGETKTVTFTLGKRAFAYYSTQMKDWYVEPGNYVIELGQSSRNVLITANIELWSTKKYPVELTLDTTYGDLQRIPGSDEILKPLSEAFDKNNESCVNDDSLGSSTKDMFDAMIRYMPLRGLIPLGDGTINFAMLEEILEKLSKLV